MTTQTVPGAVRATERRNIWSKILRKISVKKLVNKCGRSTGSQCNFLKTGVITGVSVSGCFESLAVSKLPMIISKWPNNLSGNFKTFLGFEMV